MCYTPFILVQKHSYTLLKTTSKVFTLASPPTCCYFQQCVTLGTKHAYNRSSSQAGKPTFGAFAGERLPDI